MTTPASDTKGSKKKLIAIALLAYIAAFLLFGSEDFSTWAQVFLVPLIISILAVIIYVALGAVLPPKLHLIVFFGGALAISLWYWSIPKSAQECILKEMKSAQTDSAASQIRYACQKKYGS